MSSIFDWKPGTKLGLYSPDSGYKSERERAYKLIEEHGDVPVFTIKTIDIGGFKTAITFEEVHGSFNSVQFAEYIKE